MSKTSFSDILKTHGDPFNVTSTPIFGCTAYRQFHEDRALAGRISTWLSEHGFDDWDIFNKASNTFVLCPKDNPEIVLKIHGSYEDKRRIPHLLQPIYVINIEGVTLEFLPNALGEDPQSAFQIPMLGEDGFSRAKEKLRREVIASGYSYVAPLPGLFKFIYEDPKKPGRKNATLMCYDHDDIEFSSQQKGISQCTAEYPPLAAQYREQDKIIARDPRLKKLIEEEPQPRYETMIVKERGVAILPPIPTPGRSLLSRLFGASDESKGKKR